MDLTEEVLRDRGSQDMFSYESCIEDTEFVFHKGHCKRKYQDWLAREKGYHNITHCKRPRMKQRWRKRELRKNAGN